MRWWWKTKAGEQLLKYEAGERLFCPHSIMLVFRWEAVMGKSSKCSTCLEKG